MTEDVFSIANSSADLARFRQRLLLDCSVSNLPVGHKYDYSLMHNPSSYF
jgi:hypothetical protein